MPDGNAVAPPELPRDTPVADVLQTLQQNGPLIVRHDFDQAVEHSFLGRLGKGLHLAEPLRVSVLLDDGLATVASADRMRVLGDALDQAEFLEVFDDSGAGDK